ncbi:MAG TPA: hypothetical protein VMI12_09745 [Puia sp.]|nr:hypothetical protein [Puia sp.]
MKSFLVFTVSFLLYANLVWMLLTYFSCNGRTNENALTPEETPKTKHSIIKKPPSSFNDTLIIDKESAVIYYPDSLQIEKIKAVNKKTVFDMITHDCYYQIKNAREEIGKHWKRIHIVEASKVRYLLFVKEDRTSSCIDLNDKNDVCGIFLFDKKKNPVLVDMPNINTEIGFYFQK